ncbi:MAG TPA: phosphoribosyltransferase [Candidatus Dormibacteraeota bacterium]|nr:phosphoribosyltransferase [Candidatus Dormibacteraeota bacterium]
MHTDSWLDLDQLFLRPSALQPFIAALAERLARHDIDIVCGPLSGGAFVAQLLAERLGIGFSFAERSVADARARYTIAPALRGSVERMRVALMDALYWAP